MSHDAMKVQGQMSFTLMSNWANYENDLTALTIQTSINAGNDPVASTNGTTGIDNADFLIKRKQLTSRYNVAQWESASTLNDGYDAISCNYCGTCRAANQVVTQGNSTQPAGSVGGSASGSAGGSTSGVSADGSSTAGQGGSLPSSPKLSSTEAPPVSGTTQPPVNGHQVAGASSLIASGMAILAGVLMFAIA